MGRPIFFIGYMACGKTTLSQALAIETGLDAIDLDAEIERREGMTISRIFAERGEEAFRRIERATIAEIARSYAGQDVFIACGGGTPCDPESMELMLSTGLVIWLQADIEITMERLRLQAGQRPRLAGMPDDVMRRFVVDEQDKRRQHYSRAHATFDSSHLDTVEEIRQSVRNFIEKYVSRGYTS